VLEDVEVGEGHAQLTGAGEGEAVVKAAPGSKKVHQAVAGDHGASGA